MRRAVVDVGSNSVLLLVAELRRGCWHPIAETSEVTALGEGVTRTGRLSDEAVERTLAAVGRAFRTAREAGCSQIVAAATMAVRIASNASDFLAAAAAQSTPVQVISGDEEAQLGLLAVASDPLFDSPSVSVVDVGGHSTEVSSTSGPRASYPVGTLGLRALLDDAERLDPENILAASREVDASFAGLAPAEHGSTVVAIGATATNLASIRERLERWDPDAVHGAYLECEEVSRAVGWLCPMSDSERSSVRGLEPGRERTIHLGALILERALYSLRAEVCRVSVKGWRHAMLKSLE